MTRRQSESEEDYLNRLREEFLEATKKQKTEAAQRPVREFRDRRERYTRKTSPNAADSPIAGGGEGQPRPYPSDTAEIQGRIEAAAESTVIRRSRRPVDTDTFVTLARDGTRLDPDADERIDPPKGASPRRSVIENALAGKGGAWLEARWPWGAGILRGMASNNLTGPVVALVLATLVVAVLVSPLGRNLREGKDDLNRMVAAKVPSSQPSALKNVPEYWRAPMRVDFVLGQSLALGRAIDDDFQLVRDNKGLLALHPLNARLSVQGMQEPGVDRCKTTKYSGDVIILAGLHPGQWLCMQTSEKSLVELRLDGWSQEDRIVRLTQVFWAKFQP